MMQVIRRLILLLLCVIVTVAQDSRAPSYPDDKADPKLPDGTSQKLAIIKAEHKKSVEDSQTLIELATEVHSDLEKGDANIVSIKMMKQLDEMEKLAKRIRGRLKRI